MRSKRKVKKGEDFSADEERKVVDGLFSRSSNFYIQENRSALSVQILISISYAVLALNIIVHV